MAFLPALPHFLCPGEGVWGLCHTRMIERWSLLLLHAMLPVSLSEGKCSRKLCLPQRVAFMCRAQHLLRRAHSIARMAKFVSSARDTDSHFPRLEGSCSLILCVPNATPAIFPKAHASPFCAHRTHLLPALPHFYVPVKGAGFAHPNDGTVKFAISARGAGGYFFRE